MTHKRVFVLLVVALCLVLAVPVLADATAEGLVVEAVSVPGVMLSYSRAQVAEAYGPPASCQSGSVSGDYALCSYAVEGGGPSNSPDDVVYNIRWYEQVSGWTTTAGINTALAKADPDAVIAAYPNAVVTYTSWGSISQVRDYVLGIQVNWDFSFYTESVSVSMAISYPSDPPPPPEPRSGSACERAPRSTARSGAGERTPGFSSSQPGHIPTARATRSAALFHQPGTYAPTSRG